MEYIIGPLFVGVCAGLIVFGVLMSCLATPAPQQLSCNPGSHAVQISAAAHQRVYECKPIVP